MPHKYANKQKQVSPQNPEMSHHQATPAEGEQIAAADWKRRQMQHGKDMMRLNSDEAQDDSE